MIKISKEFKTFFLVLSGIILFVFGYNFLKGQSILKKQKTIYAVYSEIEGLVSGAKVTLNGLTIGSVTRTDFVTDGTDILITMSIRGDVNFSKESEAVLYETGLIGGKAISINPIFINNQSIKSGDTLKSIIKPGFTELVNRQIEPLQDKIVGTLTSVDSLFAGVSNVLNLDTQNNLKSILEDLSVSLENVNKASVVLSDLLISNQKNFSNTMENLSISSKNINSITDSLASINFNRTVKQYELVADNINQLLLKLDSNEGTAGKLLNDDNVYLRLEAASKALEDLLNDIKLNPKRYVHFSLFGRKEK
ncbi:MAG: ABC transporter substrate-binding protein [Flavobacteriaceae bacterium]|nr:ABC transporter substrate-binding protein [Flavobacteriaceae bacterium]|tara:strand:- start:2234 stop:3157 length:924 start_codon:yes stop_codon:yes gene_type:complete